MVAVRMEANVSSTPSPRSATAGMAGTLRAFSVRSMNSTGVTSGRSRLLYWSTSGSEDGSSWCASRFSVISRKLWTFSSQRSAAEFATNTSESAPFRTSRRVAA
jgi:hypothetical protein